MDLDFYQYNMDAVSGRGGHLLLFLQKTARIRNVSKQKVLKFKRLIVIFYLENLIRVQAMETTTTKQQTMRKITLTLTR